MTSARLTDRPYASVIEATEQPRVVELGKNFYAAAFSLMKLLPARYMIDSARSSGALQPGATVIETSSGTFGLGLALVCALRGHPLTVVGDPAIDSDLRRRLELLGTQVELVDAFDGPGGIQAARLARVAELQRQNPGSFVPNQYDNPQNPAAYETVAEQLLITLGRVDRLVGPVGSGGSTCGTAAALRKAGNPVRLVGVDTPGSVIFGDHDGHRILRGLGSSIHPANVDHSAYDDVHWVGPEPAIHTTRQLYASRGMFVGPTSGAAYLVADWHAARDVDRITVALFPDDGFRYLSSVYSDRWLQAEGLSMAGLPAAPRSVGHPHEVAGPWSWMPWGRRSLDDVLHGTEGEGQRCVT